MSLYIHGMELPKSCSECFADDNGWCNILGCSIGQSVALRMIERRRDCPLVEVPPHGRLIDADALNTRERGNNSQRIMWSNIRQIVAEADTIIPASGGEETDPTDPEEGE